VAAANAKRQVELMERGLAPPPRQVRRPFSKRL
jgi:hypothetical protein